MEVDRSRVDADLWTGLSNACNDDQLSTASHNTFAKVGRLLTFKALYCTLISQSESHLRLRILPFHEGTQ